MKRWIHLKLDEELLDELDVECEILTVSRNRALAEGARWWIDEMRRRQVCRGLEAG